MAIYEEILSKSNIFAKKKKFNNIPAIYNEKYLVDLEELNLAEIEEKSCRELIKWREVEEESRYNELIEELVYGEKLYIMEHELFFKLSREYKWLMEGGYLK